MEGKLVGVCGVGILMCRTPQSGRMLQNAMSEQEWKMTPTKDGNERGTSITADNIRAVRDLIEEDRRVTISDIASHVGISFGSVQAIISDEHKFRKLSARRVPRLLSQEQTKCARKFAEASESLRGGRR
ncbi:hypothetical protein ANN_10028 [Periplaneta americana]|uniref:Uncharacterized protein n=1 Tax=Periplaneta americana TaxID=6978 RepID=A0ABQ8TMY0_PERAM|nr:hypothetical protein ANN_10028 [Periplaneta americana]